MKQFEIVTISKAKFDKLSPEKQRMTIAQDVLDRIELQQIKPDSGTTVTRHDFYNQDPLKQQLSNPEFRCDACAKGSLFLSFIGIVNNYESLEIQSDLRHKSMNLLSNIFSLYQLALIETAFEGAPMNWNYDANLSDKDIDKAMQFRRLQKETNSDTKDKLNLIAICKNIIKNKGTFIP